MTPRHATHSPTHPPARHLGFCSLLRAALCGLLGLGALLPACAGAGQLRNQIYSRGRVRYRIGTLPAAWQLHPGRGGDVIFHHPGGGTIAVSAQCPSGDDVPLDVLTNHLLFGFGAQQQHGRRLFTLDGRQALRTQLRGEMDGVPVELALVVLKKDGCTYDLQLITAPGQLAARQSDFDAFVQGFTTQPGAPAGEG